MNPQTGSSIFGFVALFAGGLVGSLVRVVLARALRSPGRLLSWSGELGLGLMFGAILALPLISSAGRLGVITSSLGGGLTAYCGACAAYAFVRAREAGVNPIPSAVGRFLASTVATGVGFVGVVSVWAALR